MLVVSVKKQLDIGFQGGSPLYQFNLSNLHEKSFNHSGLPEWFSWSGWSVGQVGLVVQVVQVVNVVQAVQVVQVVQAVHVVNVVQVVRVAWVVRGGPPS